MTSLGNLTETRSYNERRAAIRKDREAARKRLEEERQSGAVTRFGRLG